MTTTSSSSSGSSATPDGSKIPSRRILRHLWSKMAGMYGHRWVSSFGDSPERDDDGSLQPGLTDAGAMWAEALKGLTPDAIASGVRRSVLTPSGFPPTAPEFRAMCLSIPSLAHVQLLVGRAHLVDDTDLQRFLLLVMRFFDPWRVDHDEPKAWGWMVRDAYTLACEHVMAGHELPMLPAGALADPGKKKYERPTPAPDAVVQEHMSRCRELLHVARKEDTDELH